MPRAPRFPRAHAVALARDPAFASTNWGVVLAAAIAVLAALLLG